MTRKSFWRAAFALVACCSSALLGASAAQAGFSAEFVFGDSLSDNGNLASVTGAFPDPPSFDNSFTNGPVAVQLLAQSLGLSANASLWLTSPVPQGTNYAVGGATAAVGTDNIIPGVNINLPSQVAAYSASVSGHADPNALYVLMIGGNDVIDAVLGGTGPSAVTAGADQEVMEISTLAGEGAKHFLVVDVPNVGQIPLFTQETPAPAAEEATAFSLDYNRELVTKLQDLELPPGATLTDFNFFDFNASLLPIFESLGFNTTDPCYSFTGVPDSTASNTGCGPANVDTFVYFNDVHPTAPIQAAWAKGLEGVVPEPSTWTMLLVGFAGLGFAGYRRAAQARPATA
jgi:phospholipase/lecithinase/hemolysin